MDGLWINVCPECHRKIHANQLDYLWLKEAAQRLYEAEYGHDDWMWRYGKNYLCLHSDFYFSTTKVLDCKLNLFFFKNWISDSESDKSTWFITGSSLLYTGWQIHNFR